MEDARSITAINARGVVIMSTEVVTGESHSETRKDIAASLLGCDVGLHNELVRAPSNLGVPH